MEAVLYLPLSGRGAWPLLDAQRGLTRPGEKTRVEMKTMLEQPRPVLHALLLAKPSRVRADGKLLFVVLQLSRSD